METFTEKWLSAREMEDTACRCPELLDIIDSLFRDFDRLTILDIACGSGSTMRALLPKLSQQQHWHLIDHDSALLMKAKILNSSMLGKSKHHLTLCQKNLTEGFDYLNGNYNLITTSAFLDLVSENWMSDLIKVLKANSTVFYGALTAGNSIEIKPSNPLDEKILSIFKSHQYTDKGFGSALGPDANMVVKKMFDHAGFKTHLREYEWGMQYGVENNRKELYPMFLKGVVSAVEETGQVEKTEINQWFESKMDSVKAENCEIRVLYGDLLAIPG